MSKIGVLLRHEHVLAIGLLILCELILYRDVVFGGRTFLMPNYMGHTMPLSQGGGSYGHPTTETQSARTVGDPWAVATIREPMQFYSRVTWRAGEIPLWDPHTGLGQSHIAAGQSAVFDPLQVISYVCPTPLWTYAMDLEVLLRCFLAGLFTYLFARNVNLRFLSAVFAGAAVLMSNRFLTYGNHAQMRVELLIPLLFFSFERLADRPAAGNVLLATASVLWLYLADFAEAAFMAMSFACIWYAFNVLSKSVKVGDWCSIRPRVINLAIVLGCAHALAAPVLVPFVENVFLSHSVHQPGATSIGLPRHNYSGLILALVPYHLNYEGMFGPIHFSMTSVTLALFGVIQTVRKKVGWMVGGFFSVYFLVFFAKMYGCPMTAWISRLPVYNQVGAGYALPSLEFCVALLAALGIEHFLAWRASWRVISSVALCIFALLCFLVNHADPWQLGDHVFVRSLIKILLVMAGCCVLLLAGVWVRLRPAGVIVCLLGILVLETCSWRTRIHRPVRHYPYREPPFVAFLKEQGDAYRICAEDGILMPTISMAYCVDDLRYCVALDPRRRMKFIESLISSDFKDMRLVGSEKSIYYDRFFDLVNGRYVLTTSGMPPKNRYSLYDDPAFIAKLHQSRGISEDTIKIDNNPRTVLKMALTNEFSFPIRVPVGRAVLLCGMGPKPDGEPGAGGPLTCTIIVEDQSGRHERLHRQLERQDRRWFRTSIDLSAWSGQQVTVCLQAKSLSQSGATEAIYWDMPVCTVNDSPHCWSQSAATNADSVFVTEIVGQQDLLASSDSFQLRPVVIQGIPRRGISQRPRAARSVPLSLPAAPCNLRFSTGVQLDGVKKSDEGFTFQIDIRSGDGDSPLFIRHLGPIRQDSDMCWLDASVDLTPWSGRNIELVLSAKGPRKDAWACWGNMELTGTGVRPANVAPTKFELAYDRDGVQVYRNRWAFPRAFVVHRIGTAATIDQALEHLMRSDFDPSSSAVVDGDLPATWNRSLLGRENERIAPSPAEVIRRTANTMKIRTTLNKPGLLVTSDSYDPGWQAFVDGKSASIVPADVALRGVYLEAGAHEIDFVYGPASFRWGLVLAAAGAACLIFWVIFTLRSKDTSALAAGSV